MAEQGVFIPSLVPSPPSPDVPPSAAEQCDESLPQPFPQPERTSENKSLWWRRRKVIAADDDESDHNDDGDLPASTLCLASRNSLSIYRSCCSLVPT